MTTKVTIVHPESSHDTVLVRIFRPIDGLQSGSALLAAGEQFETYLHSQASLIVSEVAAGTKFDDPQPQVGVPIPVDKKVELALEQLIALGWAWNGVGWTESAVSTAA